MNQRSYYDVEVKYQGQKQLARLHANKIELRQLSVVIPFHKKNTRIGFRFPFVILVEDQNKHVVELPVNRLTLALIFPFLELYFVVLSLLAVCSFLLPFFVFGHSLFGIMPFLAGFFSVLLNIALAIFFLLQLHAQSYKKALNIWLLNTVLSLFLIFKFPSFLWLIILFYALPFFFLFIAYFINNNSFLLKKLFFVFSWWQSVMLTFPLLIFFLFFSFDVVQWHKKTENNFLVKNKNNNYSISSSQENISWQPTPPLSAQKFSFSKFLFFSFFSNKTFLRIVLVSPQLLLSYFDHENIGSVSVYKKDISQTLQSLDDIFKMKQLWSVSVEGQPTVTSIDLKKYNVQGQALFYQLPMTNILNKEKFFLLFIFFQKEGSSYTYFWLFDLPVDSNSNVLIDTLFLGLQENKN